MNLTFLPCKCAGYAFVDNEDIFVSTLYRPESILDTVKHEIAHILRGNNEHDKKWYDIYRSLGGTKPFNFIYSPNIGNIDVALNVGNVTGIQNILTDFHLLQAYRKFSQRILGTEGQWEFKGDRKIRLFPTPRGSFPVFVEYLPQVQYFTSPHAKEITKRALVAEAKIMLGNSRSKFGNIPGPDGGSLQLNGDALRTEGQAEKDKAVQDAILFGEPLGIYTW